MDNLNPKKMFDISPKLTSEVNSLINEGAWKKKVLESLMIIILGGLTLTGALYTIYYTEGRVDIREKVMEAVVINPLNEDIHPRKHEKLMTMTGQLRLDKGAEDEFVRTGNYVVIKRYVEHFAWTEEDGKYEKKWVTDIPNHELFRDKEGHVNVRPSLDIKPKVLASEGVHLGDYGMETSILNYPLLTPLNFNEKDITLPQGFNPPGLKRVESKYFFNGRSFDEPEVGDVRIFYSGVKSGGIVTVLGKLNLIKKRVEPFVAENGVTLYHFFNGTREEFIRNAKSDHVAKTWRLRAISFLLMWLAMAMIIAPVALATKTLPFFDKVSVKRITVFTFVMAVAICLAATMVFDRIWDRGAFVSTLIVTGGMITLMIKKKAVKNKKNQMKKAMRRVYEDQPESAVSIMKKKITAVLTANPKIKYKEAKKMAENANIAVEIFEDAWDETHHRRGTILKKVLPLVVIVMTIGFSVRVGTENRETLYDLVYDIRQDTKQDILKLLPTEMPYWAKELGIEHPIDLALDKEQTILTSVQNSKEGYHSLKFVYRGKPEIVMEQSKIMAANAGVSVARANGKPLAGRTFAQYGTPGDRFGENREFSIVILAYEDQLTLNVTNERQLEAQKRISQRKAEEAERLKREHEERVAEDEAKKKEGDELAKNTLTENVTQ